VVFGVYFACPFDISKIVKISTYVKMVAENYQNYFLNLQFLSTSDPINPSSSINPKVALRFPEGHQVAGGPP